MATEEPGSTPADFQAAPTPESGSLIKILN